MAMRETRGSLQAYFIVVGLLSGLSAAKDLDGGNGLVKALFAVQILLSVGYIYFGVTLKRQLVDNPGRIQLFLLACGGLSIGIRCGVAAYVANRAGFEAVSTALYVGVGLTILITWYLLVNVRRLATSGDTDKGTASTGR